MDPTGASFVSRTGQSTSVGENKASADSKVGDSKVGDSKVGESHARPVASRQNSLKEPVTEQPEELPVALNSRVVQ
jgi:hypothetical protein